MSRAGNTRSADAALLIVTIVLTIPPRTLPRRVIHHPDQYCFSSYRPLVQEVPRRRRQSRHLLHRKRARQCFEESDDVGDLHVA